MFKFYKIMLLGLFLFVWFRFVLPITVSSNYDELVYGSIIITILMLPLIGYIVYNFVKDKNLFKKGGKNG